jgi:hypothetical protein
VTLILPPSVDPKRDWVKRPLVYPVGSDPAKDKTKAYTRVTTFVGALEDNFNLTKWQLRQAMIGLADRPDLLLSVSAHRDDKDELNAIAEKAIEASKAGASAVSGTAYHLLTEKIDRGEPLPFLPESARLDLEAFRIRTAGLTVCEIERFLVNDELQAAGTTDRIYDVPGFGRVIGDTKTGKSVELGILKIAMQLATYSRSKAYCVDSGQRFDIDVSQDWGLIVHLPAGTGACHLWWVNLQIGWAGVQLAKAVREFRKIKFKDLTHEIPPAAVEAAA